MLIHAPDGLPQGTGPFGSNGDRQVVHMVDARSRMVVGPRRDAGRRLLLPTQGGHGTNTRAHVAGAIGGNGACRVVDDAHTGVAHRAHAARLRARAFRLGSFAAL